MKTILKFAKDTSVGWGVMNEKAYDKFNHARWGLDTYNTFWDGVGIFHDAFEHYFEDLHPYFKGDAAFSWVGEMAAMGHYMYYGRFVNHRYTSRYHALDSIAINEAYHRVQECLSEGRFDFGDKWVTRIRKQPTYSEVQGKQVIDWNARLELPWKQKRVNRLKPETGTTLRPMLGWIMEATDWVTCACGNQCAAIPRRPSGRPVDSSLSNLGIDFSVHIGNMSKAKDEEAYTSARDAAKFTLLMIEKRSIEILKEIQNGNNY